MTTRRERLERKLEKRAEWAAKARARSAARLSTAHDMASVIPFGQPILVGHHSEKRDRNYRGRIQSNFEKGFEEANLAKHHAEKADGLEAQLDSSVFSDDADAVEQLQARIAEREVKRDRYKAVNAAWKKAGKPKSDDAEGWARVASLLATDEEKALALRGLKTLQLCPYHEKPFPSYVFSNLSANIRRDKGRIEEVRRRQARAAKAEEAGGVVVEGTGEWCRVTFAEKPARAVLDALKAAGFMWGGGSWTGKRASLPEGVQP